MLEYESFASQKDPFCIAVVADSHIPDHTRAFPAGFDTRLGAIKPDLLLHAGDIILPETLRALAAFAPVRAVKGNRDFLFGKELPLVRGIAVYGQKIVLTHGHLNTAVYWRDKVAFALRGYHFERYLRRFEHCFPEANVIVFGHTHRCENRWKNGRLYLNPGLLSGRDQRFPTPHIGVLNVYENGTIEANLIPIEGEGQ
jgi:putative phosphoesterase